MTHSFGRLVVYHQKGQYHYVLTPPFDLPSTKLMEQEPEVLSNYFKVVPSLRGKINRAIVTGLNFAFWNGTVVAPVLDVLRSSEEETERD